MSQILDNPFALGAFAVVVLLVVVWIAAKLTGSKRSGSGSSSGDGKSGCGVTVKAKLVWIEASEGPFSNAFEFNARREIQNASLRELLVKVVQAYDRKKKGGVILNHPSGKEMQVIKFRGGQKVAGKPYLAVEYISFTSDRRRTMLFLDGVKHDEIECKNADIFELARKNILAYKETGRKTCPLSNLGTRDTFVAPTQKEG